MVAQGKVQELADKGEAGYLEMLKEVTGTAQFDSKIEAMGKSMLEAKAKKEQLQEVLQQIKSKLEKLGGEIEVFNGFDNLEKDKKAYERCLYAHKARANFQEIEGLRTQKAQLMAEREELMREQVPLDEEEARPSALEEEIAQIELKISGLQMVRQELARKEMGELEHFGNLGGQQSSVLLGSAQQRSLLDFWGASDINLNFQKEQLAQVQTSLQEAREEVQNLEAQKERMAAEATEMAHKLAELQKEKDTLLLQKEAAQNMSSPAQIVKFYTAEQNRLQAQCAAAEQDTATLARERKTLTKHIADLQQR